MLRVGAVLLVFAGCSGPTPESAPNAAAAVNRASPTPKGSQAAPPADLPPVDADLLRRHIAELADDRYGGRRPGTEGAKKTVAYLEAQYEALGLVPAGDDGTYRQTVPMRGVTADPARTTAAFVADASAPVPLVPGEEIVVGSYRESGTNHFDAELVFVGYGITAPEEKWDDYEGVDVRNKIVVALVGDPPLGEGRFGGDALTYYGRWTYKFERALEAGAAGCLVVHETEPASYGWNVVESSWSGERFHVVEPGGELPAALQAQGWLHRDAADRLAKMAKSSLAAWHEAAIAPDFEARPLGVSLRGEVVTRERQMSDVNVIGRIPGDDAPEDSFIVTAHWDHLGTKPDAAEGEDAIFNGAVDNASGIAGMLATATAIQHHRAAGHPLARSVVFLATTAEEQGLLGSRYYAAHPLVDLGRVRGVANLDSMNVHGRTETITVVGAGQSTLEDALAEIAADEGRAIVPDDRPEAGAYYRSDHFSFAKRGVPALFFHGGPRMVDGGLAEGERLAEQRSRRYHTVDDEPSGDWPLTGAVQDVQTLSRLIVRVVNAAQPPRWKPTSEFASVRR